MQRTRRRRGAFECRAGRTGDIVIAVHEGDASRDGIVALGEVLAGLAAARPGRCTVFESLGVGIEDVAAAAAIACAG
jgi:ornithine cyclodeaminase/alanine dehydrogenase-like protein (mu-crystallin family)